MGGKTSNASKAKYNAKAYDRIIFTVSKGRKEDIKAHAESKGMSLNAYINELIERDMAGK
jgi:predicted DNA binding CopG/RHH family protein